MGVSENLGELAAMEMGLGKAISKTTTVEIKNISLNLLISPNKTEVPLIQETIA